MAKKVAVKTRKPTDATLRNVRAARARNAVLKKRLDALERQMQGVLRALADQLVVVNVD